MRNLSFCICAYQSGSTSGIENLYYNQGYLYQNNIVQNLHNLIRNKYSERRKLYSDLLNVNNYLSVQELMKSNNNQIYLENSDYKYSNNLKKKIQQELQRVHQEIYNIQMQISSLNIVNLNSINH